MNRGGWLGDALTLVDGRPSHEDLAREAEVAHRTRGGVSAGVAFGLHRAPPAVPAAPVPYRAEHGVRDGRGG